MKTKLFFLPILALTATLSVSAQQIENDDLYFNSKDRAKQKSSYQASLTANSEVVAKGIKSSDQYSGRTINPEYTSRLNANSNAIQGSTNPYFDSDYQSNSGNNSGYYNGFNNSYYGNSFNNPYYGNSWSNPYSNLYGYSGMNGMYGSGMYGYNPYSSFYSSYSPYGFSSGLSIGLTFGNAFYSPYYGYNSMMYGYGGGFGGYNPYYPYGYYPSTIIINNGDNGSNIVYGKRSSRSSMGGNSVMVPTTRGTASTGNSQGQDTQYSIPVNGRTQQSGSTQQYYQPNWRNNPDVNVNSRQNGSMNSRSQSLGTQNPSWNSGTISRPTQNPGWNTTRQSIPSNNSFESPSRGSSTPSWGGSSGGGSVGGSSGHSSGGSRGRN